MQNQNIGLDYSNSNVLYSNTERLKSDGAPVSAIVKIKYTGDYKEDFKMANQKGFGQNSTPLMDAHNGISHSGGVGQYQKATGNSYNFRSW